MPGNTAPAIFLAGLESDDLSVELAEEFGKTPGEMAMALGHANGADHHDYFGEFAIAVNLEKAAVVRGFAKLWISRPNNIEIAREFLKTFRVGSGSGLE